MKIMMVLIFLLPFVGVLSYVGASDENWIHVAGGTWNPSSEIITDLKNRIESDVTNQADSQGRKLMSWQDYIFQYQGKEVNGWKIIFINALCVPINKQGLNKQIVQILDGGSCYFNVKFDPRKKVFFELFINGES